MFRFLEDFEQRIAHYPWQCSLLTILLRFTTYTLICSSVILYDIKTTFLQSAENERQFRDKNELELKMWTQEILKG